MRLADRTGAPLAELVERIEADARATDRGLAAAAAQAAGARATAWLLAALPLGGIGLGYGIGVDPVAVLLHSTVGGACAIVAIALQVVRPALGRAAGRDAGAGSADVHRCATSGRSPRPRLARPGPATGRGRQLGEAAGGRTRSGSLAVLAGLAVAVVVGGWLGLLGAVPTAVLLDVPAAADRVRRLRATGGFGRPPTCRSPPTCWLRRCGRVPRWTARCWPSPRRWTARSPAGWPGSAARCCSAVAQRRRGQRWTGCPGAERLAAAALRSANSGAALAGALTRLADDLRADRATAAEASARRAGVLIVLPLGLCFLPAFILAGLVPVIVAVLGDVL